MAQFYAVAELLEIAVCGSHLCLSEGGTGSIRLLRCSVWGQAGLFRSNMSPISVGPGEFFFGVWIHARRRQPCTEGASIPIRIVPGGEPDDPALIRAVSVR